MTCQDPVRVECLRHFADACADLADPEVIKGAWPGDADRSLAAPARGLGS